MPKAPPRKQDQDCGTCALLVIENHDADGVEWGVSFDGPNPGLDEYVAVQTRQDAFKAANLVRRRLHMEKVNFGDVIRAVCSPLGFYTLVVLVFGTALVANGGPTADVFWNSYGPIIGVVLLVWLTSVFFPKSLLLSEWGLLAGIGRGAYGSVVATTDAEGTWGVSFNGPNPEARDWVAVTSREDAFKLVNLVGLMSWAQLNRPQSRLTNQGEA